MHACKRASSKICPFHLTTRVIQSDCKVPLRLSEESKRGSMNGVADRGAERWDNVRSQQLLVRLDESGDLHTKSL